MIPFTNKIHINQFFCFFLFVFSSTFAAAQKFTIGAQAAASYNNSYGQGTNTYLPNPIYGGSLGAFGTFQLFEKFKIRAEALFSTRGLNSEFGSTGASSTPLYSGSIPTLAASSSVSTGAGGSYSSTQKQYTIYLDLPLGIDYEVIPHVNLQAGGIFSVFIKEYYNSLSNNSTVEQPQPSDTQYYQNFQFYVYGGAYYQFNFGLLAGARASVGLSQTFLPVSNENSNQVYPYNFQLFVAYPLFKF